MSKTKISWTERTWNPTTGCTKISPGCAHCYAEKETKRLSKNPRTEQYRAGFDKFVAHPDLLDKPLHWKKPRMVFVNSMSDTFHKDCSEAFIVKLFEVMGKHTQHIFQILTKRSKRLLELSPKLKWPDNVWMGITVENADFLSRLEDLRKVPAKVRFVSFEPLLGAIPDIDFTGIHWVIVGGESGSKARTMELQWARDIRDQCLDSKVPFFFKQVGGKKKGKGGKVLDGRTWEYHPDREYWPNFPDRFTNSCASLPAISSGWMRPGTLSLRRKGSCNVLVVVPHGYQNDDDNADILGYALAERLNSYAIVNNRKYERSGTLPKGVYPGCAIVDLNDPREAENIPEYWKAVLGYTNNILRKFSKPPALVFYIHGMGDSNSIKYGAGDICIGKGFTGVHDPNSASASEKFFTQLIDGLKSAGMGSITDEVPKLRGEGKMPRALRENFGANVEAVQIEFRCTGYRDSPENIIARAEQLSEVIKGLAGFRRTGGSQMTSKKKSPEPEALNTTQEDTLQITASDTAEVQPGEYPSLSIDPLAEEKFNELITRLQDAEDINGDDGKTIVFGGETREAFIEDVKDGYTFFKRLLNVNYYQAGRFFSFVRARQKPKKLWLTYLKTIGFPRRTAHKYIQVYESIGEDLAKYAYLGSSKLEIITRLKKKDVMPFLEAHAQDIEQNTVEELRETIKEELKPKKPRKTSKPEVIKKGSVKIELGKKKTSILITGLNKDNFDKILTDITELFTE